MIGSKVQVWRGVADRTSGGLTKEDLMKNKRGKIVSKRQHAQGVKMFAANQLTPKSAEELAAIK